MHCRGREFEVVVDSPRVDGSVDEQGQLRLQQAALVGLLLQTPYAAAATRAPVAS